MGGGSWDTKKYSSSVSDRALKNVPDFEYSEKSNESTPIHANLNPMRIKDKPLKKLESRDSLEHPKSHPVFVSIDVTGSNYERAMEAQKKLPNLMDLLHKYVDDPQILIAANDDFHSVGKKAVQISDYESDNRIDEHIRNLLLLRQGGGNDGESYDLVLWAAANRTVLDCMEIRHEKGYFFMYADEPIFRTTSAEHVKAVFGIDIPGSIGIEHTIEKLKQLYHVFVMWPLNGFDHAREQYVKLFGKECVVTLQQPRLICEMIGSLIGMTEGKLNDDASVVNDLVSVGTSASDAKIISAVLAGHRKIHLPHATA
jgi:hypothetical protein